VTDQLSNYRRRINELDLAHEVEFIQDLVAESVFDPALRNKITAQTAILVSDLRRKSATSFLQSFLGEYGLSTAEIKKALESMQNEKLAVDILEGVPRSDALNGYTGIDAVSFYVTDTN